MVFQEHCQRPGSSHKLSHSSCQLLSLLRLDAEQTPVESPCGTPRSHRPLLSHLTLSHEVETPGRFPLCTPLSASLPAGVKVSKVKRRWSIS